MSYAVIATGGKQYRVEPGQTLTVEKLAGEVGDSVELPCVMLVDDSGSVAAGTAVAGRTVPATITQHGRGRKIRVATYKNKSRQHKRRGHRQPHTTLEVGSF